MKKKLLFTFAAMCSLMAQAQYQNPYVYTMGEQAEISVDVSMLNEQKQYISLPQDTTMDLGTFTFGLNMKFDKRKPGTVDITTFLSELSIDIQVLDYYEREMLMGNQRDGKWNLTMNMEEVDIAQSSINIDFKMAKPSVGGHYNWQWVGNNDFGQMSGHVELLEKPSSSIWGTNDKMPSLTEYETLIIHSKVNTGYPYDANLYQGQTHYTVYDPDSVIICERDIDLRINADSTMNGQLQEDVICSIDSARCGKYLVRMEGAYMDKPHTWVIEVKDPMANASSRNPVNATYRFAESNFALEGKGKGWKYTGGVKPSYYTDQNKTKQSVMVVRPDEDSHGNAFTLTQSAGMMPQGFYALTLPVVYQPCKFRDMTGNEEMLASVSVNGYTRKASHIMSGATMSTVNEGGRTYMSCVVPSSDNAFADHLALGWYNQEMLFEVREDSLITLEVHKSNTDLSGEITAIGAIDLMYYGAGLPYGDVEFSEDSVFVAGDSIGIRVKLYDGVGYPVKSDNTISILIAPATEQGIDSVGIVLAQELVAAKADEYDVSVMLPADAAYKDVAYRVMVASLLFDGKYEMLENKIIQIMSTTTAIELPQSENSAVENAPIYNLMGIMQNANVRPQGIYIQGRGRQIVVD